MIPGAHHQFIIVLCLLLYCFIGIPCTKAILGIKEATYHHRCCSIRYIVYEIPGVPCLPPRIVVWVSIKILPEFYAITHICRQFLQGTSLEIEFIIIAVGIGKSCGSYCCWFWPGFTKSRIKSKSIHLEEGSIVMEVVPNKPIGHRCLGAYGFQGGMTAK